MTGAHIDIGDRPDFERNLAELRLRLNESVFTAAWEEGRAMSLEQAIGLAFSDFS